MFILKPKIFQMPTRIFKLLHSFPSRQDLFKDMNFNLRKYDLLNKSRSHPCKRSILICRVIFPWLKIHVQSAYPNQPTFGHQYTDDVCLSIFRRHFTIFIRFKYWYPFPGCSNMPLMSFVWREDGVGICINRLRNLETNSRLPKYVGKAYWSLEC